LLTSFFLRFIIVPTAASPSCNIAINEPTNKVLGTKRKKRLDFLM
jgi:hypothetical protein